MLPLRTDINVRALWQTELTRYLSANVTELSRVGSVHDLVMLPNRAVLQYGAARHQGQSRNVKSWRFGRNGVLARMVRV